MLVRVALAQFDCHLGQVDANLDQVRQLTAEASAQQADLVVFPELAVHGYWLGQLPESRSLGVHDPRLGGLADGRPDVLAGFHEDSGVRTYNSAAYLSGGAAVHVHRKLYLPTTSTGRNESITALGSRCARSTRVMAAPPC